MSNAALVLGGHPWHQVTAGTSSMLSLLWPMVWFGPLLGIAVARWLPGGGSAIRGPAVKLKGTGPAAPAATDADRTDAARAETGPGVGVSRPLLVSHAEREEASRVVSHAVGQGQLSLEEAGDRIDGVLRARHRHQLEELLADLPIGLPNPERPTPKPRLRGGLLAVVGILTLTAVLVQSLLGLWEIWPVALVTFAPLAWLPRR